MVHSKDKIRTPITSLAAYITIPSSLAKAHEPAEQTPHPEPKRQKVTSTPSNKATRNHDPTQPKGKEHPLLSKGKSIQTTGQHTTSTTPRTIGTCRQPQDQDNLPNTSISTGTCKENAVLFPITVFDHDILDSGRVASLQTGQYGTPVNTNDIRKSEALQSESTPIDNIKENKTAPLAYLNPQQEATHYPALHIERSRTSLFAHQGWTLSNTRMVTTMDISNPTTGLPMTSLTAKAQVNLQSKP